MSLDSLQLYTLFGIQLVNFNDLGYLLLKFATDLFFVLIIIRFIFYSRYKNREYVFSTLLINIAIFLICFLMATIKLKIGFAFGLFAVFSIIRYRTEAIPIREMTYLFVAIIIAVINALSGTTISYAELILANMIIMLTTYFVENNFLHKKEFIKTIKYEKIELIRPENYDRLIADLKERTGFNVKRADIDSINFMNDTATLKILYEYSDGKAKDRDNGKKN